ncbi:MAG TPA: hypothetical protein VF824_17640 [Thermoanaerobaculia bacterium]|jgi:hypothetical protein
MARHARNTVPITRRAPANGGGAITTHLRSILSEVAPDRVDSLLPVVERCVMQVVAPADVVPDGPMVAAALDTTGTSAGADLMQRAANLPFPEFVAKLVTGTFDAIVTAHINQSKAYAELVAELAKTVQEFESSSVTDDRIDDFLKQNYPDGSGGTSITSGAAFDQAVFDDIVDVRLKNVWSSEVTKPTAPSSGTTTWDDATVKAIRAGVRRFLAKSGLDQLRAMARDGMQFVAVTSGEINAKLTFSVSAIDQSTTNSSQFNVRQSSFGANASASYHWLKASAAYSASRVSVATVNTSNFNKVTMDAQLVGEVKLQFQTRTLPPIG